MNGHMRRLMGAMFLLTVSLVGCAREHKGIGGEDYLDKSDRQKLQGMLPVEVMPDSAVPNISSSHITNVSYRMAVAKCQQAMCNYDQADAKAIGYSFPLSTVYEPELLTRQIVDRHVYWIGILGFKKYYAQAAYIQMGGISPGIMVVDAEDETRPARIMLRNAKGEPYKIKLHNRNIMWDSMYVGRYLKEHGCGTPTDIGRWTGHDPYLEDITPEVEDGTWNIYFSCTRNRPTIWRTNSSYHGTVVDAVILVDAQSCEIKQYDPQKDQIPAWVDRIYSERLVVERLNDWGYNVENFGLTSSKGQLVVDQNDLDVVCDESCKVLQYVGVMTSVKCDDSAVGVIVVGTRDLKARFYPKYGDQAMATRDQAIKTINSVNMYKGWQVEDATLQWLYGRFTWEGVYTMPIKYSEQHEGKNEEGAEEVLGSLYMGTVLTPADCDMSGGKVVWDTNKQAAFDKYEHSLFVAQTSNVGSFALDELQANGTISSWQQLTDEGHTVYVFRLAEPAYNNLLFKLELRNSYDRDTVDALGTKLGDQVRFTYGDDKRSPTCFAKHFRNLTNPVWKAR